MSKYNYLNRNGSHGIILEQIKPGSTVLELGCATGYMTKYMSEELGCVTDIVEIDADACKTASQYARNAFCGNLDDNGWWAYYRREKYDYILFADVLEHLKDPYTVLDLAVTLLKDDGRVIISIPNVCHNDIIIQMYYNHWKYSGLGLLDNTHIRFWGKDELEGMVYGRGLMVENWKSVTVQTQCTEQRFPMKVDDDLINMLRKREYGDVYQWIVICRKV